MRNLITLLVVLFAVTLYAQDVTVQDGKYLMQETYFNPDGFPESYSGSVEMQNGNINILAPGDPFTLAIGILSVQKDGQIGFNTTAAEAGLHMKQNASIAAGHRGSRLQNNKGNHWTIEINEDDNELDFYYNGTYQASIGTNGDYANPLTNGNTSVSRLRSNEYRNEKSIDNQITLQSRTIQSLHEKIRFLKEKISSLIN